MTNAVRRRSAPATGLAMAAVALAVTGCAASPAPEQTTSAVAGCLGVGAAPPLDGVASAGFGAELTVADGATSYRVQIDPPEESQHSDLPAGSEQEILVVPVSIDVLAGQPVVGIDTFAVFDAAGRRCTVPEDQVGYPVLPVVQQPAGGHVDGVIGVVAMRGTRTFTVVHLVGGVPVGVWR